MSGKAGDNLKKYLMFLLSIMLTVSGCGKKPESSSGTTEYYGPMTAEDTRKDEEKILTMIQGCINDYNINRIPEIEEYLNTQLHPLPIGVNSLPEISSLNDLKEENSYIENSNVTYAGSYMIDNTFKIIFLVYEPTGNSFWLNGRVLFQIDPSLVVRDNPDYSEYKTALDTLLAREKNVLPWLYGLNLNLGSQGPFEGYYEVLSIGDVHPTSISQIMEIAEQVFTHEYLEKTFYYSAFYSESPMFQEADGKVYCAKSDLALQENSYVYDTHYIINAEKRDSIIYIDMLGDSVGEVQPDIKRLTLAITEDGYRLPSAY